MKRLFFSLILLIVIISGLYARNDVMYVYRSDGMINAFLKTDIDSIRYSKLDLDSVAHKMNVVQEVWAIDSVYRIPLAIIDSVSMITPETVYKPGTVNITAEMRNYIVASTYSELTFATSTPSNLLPSVGDKLVNTEGSGGLLTGFLGQVREIRNTEAGYLLCCDPLLVTDVFDCYYGIIGGEESEPANAPRRAQSDGYYGLNGTWKPDPFNVNIINQHGSEMSYQKDGNAIIPSIGDGELSFTLKPKIRSISHLIVTRDYGVNVSIGLYGEFTMEEYFALSGSLSAGGDIVKFFDLPLFRNPEILCEISAESGIFLRGTVKISTKQKWTQKYVSNFHWEYSSKGEESLNNINTIKNVDNSHSGILAIKGSLECGVYLSFNIACIFTSQLDLLEVGPRMEGGLRFEGTALPYISNAQDAIKSTELYNMMKGEGVETSLYYGTSAYAKYRKLGIGWPLPGDFFGKKKVLDASYYVPDFANTKLQKNEDGSMFASTDVLGKCGPVNIGFSLQCKNDYRDRVDGYGIYDYRGPKTSNYATFYNKPFNKPYIVYPLVKYGEIEMIAEPSAEIEEDLRAQLIRFYQSTNGDNWFRNDNWCTDEPLDTWYGVSFHNSASAIRLVLDLDRNNLSGDGYLADCTALWYLSCDFNQLTSLDLSGCSTLEYLYCNRNQLTSLNLNGCTALQAFSCDGNQLTSLDVSGCIALWRLDCSANQLTSLDLSGCSTLEDLSCSSNQLTSLDLSGCSTLQDLFCGGNQLTSLDVSGCTALWLLDCNSNQLTSLDLSGCSTLQDLSCNSNQLTSLDLSGCSTLQDLYCSANQLTSLNVNGCTALLDFSCGGNQLTSLNVNGCTALQDFSCGGNQLTSLNVNGCTALWRLSCGGNQLTSLDVSGCTALCRLSCEDNQLTSLDVSGCTALREFLFSGNSLMSLDVSGCTSLTLLDCPGYQLTSLNVSGCTALMGLDCHGNQLTSLDVSGCTALEGLDCHSNQLTSLNVSGCTALDYILCIDNHFNQEIPVELDRVSFNHDVKYIYSYKWENGHGKWSWTTNEYGWWYPGEPESHEHHR